MIFSIDCLKFPKYSFYFIHASSERSKLVPDTVECHYRSFSFEHQHARDYFESFNKFWIQQNKCFLKKFCCSFSAPLSPNLG